MKTKKNKQAKKRLKQSAHKFNNAKVLTIFKSVLLGPIATILVCGILYFLWWGISRVFYTLHWWVKESVIPWAQEAWPYMLGIWGFILITSIIYAIVAETRKKKKEISIVEEENINITEEKFDVTENSEKIDLFPEYTEFNELG